MDHSDSFPPRFRITRAPLPAASADHPVVMGTRRHLLNRDPAFQVTIRAGDPLFVREHHANAAVSYLQAVYVIRRPFVHDDFDYLQQVVRQVQCVVRWTPLS